MEGMKMFCNEMFWNVVVIEIEDFYIW